MSNVSTTGHTAGGIVVGSLSDMFGGRRACVIALFNALLIPILAVFAEYGVPWPQNPTPGLLLLLAVIGCLISGPINIITSAVAVDLAENSILAGRNDLMAVTGIINGSGSIVAAMGLILIGPMQARYGWRVIWYLITLCTALGTLLLSPAIWKELTRTAEETSPVSTGTPAHRNYQSVATHSDDV
jgi:OPA family glycerol-3-phosphate transporter-like MFS transporter 1/2